VDHNEDGGVEVGGEAPEQDLERSDAAGGPHDGDDMDRRPLSRRGPSRSRRAGGE
jgi:hypothetical protein